MTLDPPKEFPWKIGASLDQLYRIMINIVEFHSIPDIITAVADQIPIVTESAMVEADAVATRIKQIVFNVLNLYGTMFLTSNGKHSKLFKPYNLKDRPSDLSYFSFQCEVDAKITIDYRINYKSLSLHFCLKTFPNIYIIQTWSILNHYSHPHP